MCPLVLSSHRIDHTMFHHDRISEDHIGTEEDQDLDYERLPFKSAHPYVTDSRDPWDSRSDLGYTRGCARGCRIGQYLDGSLPELISGARDHKGYDDSTDRIGEREPKSHTDQSYEDRHTTPHIGRKMKRVRFECLTVRLSRDPEQVTRTKKINCDRPEDEEDRIPSDLYVCRLSQDT